MQIRKLKGSLLFTLYFLLSLPLIAQQFKNLDFKQSCDTSKTGLCYWDQSWGAKGSIQPQRLEKANGILIYGKTENSVGFTEQTSFYPSKSISILTISASVRSDSVVGKGAGLNIGLYNDSGLLIANKDMGEYYLYNPGYSHHIINFISLKFPKHAKTYSIKQESH